MNQDESIKKLDALFDQVEEIAKESKKLSAQREAIRLQSSALVKQISVELHELMNSTNYSYKQKPAQRPLKIVQ